MNIEQLRNLGAPFDKAELQLSLSDRRARLTLIVPSFPSESYPQMEFPVNSFDLAVVTSGIIAAATITGLLHDESEVAVVKVDSLSKLVMIQ